MEVADALVSPQRGTYPSLRADRPETTSDHFVVTVEPPVLVDWPHEHVLRVRLNRPSRHNAIDQELLDGLYEAFQLPGARGIVLCSSTRGTFCAGADLTQSDAKRASVSESLYALYRLMTDLETPIVAALSGPAVGGGAQLAVASDLRVAETAAWIQFVGPVHGLAVGAWALPALVGRGAAFDLCLTGRRVDAVDALHMGLVDRVVEDAMADSLHLAIGLTALDPGAVARVKSIVGHATDRHHALAMEALGNRCWSGHVAGAAPRAEMLSDG